jgi:hypothetical protein
MSVNQSEVDWDIAKQIPGLFSRCRELGIVSFMNLSCWAHIVYNQLSWIVWRKRSLENILSFCLQEATPTETVLSRHLINWQKLISKNTRCRWVYSAHYSCHVNNRPNKQHSHLPSTRYSYKTWRLLTFFHKQLGPLTWHHSPKVKVIRLKLESQLVPSLNSVPISFFHTQLPIHHKHGRETRILDKSQKTTLSKKNSFTSTPPPWLEQKAIE